MGRAKKISIIFLLLVVLILLGGFIRVEGEKEDIVMWIGAIPVGRAEFEEAMGEEYANTCSYFSRVYKAQMDESFWNKKFDGITPFDYLKEKAGERLFEEKLLQLIALDLELEVEVDYKNRIADWKEENEHRRKMIEHNQPVYGPVQLGWRQYKQDVEGELLQKIKNTLYENMEFTEKELDAYYEAHKESYFSSPRDYQIEYKLKSAVSSEMKLDPFIHITNAKAAVDGKCYLLVGCTKWNRLK